MKLYPSNASQPSLVTLGSGSRMRDTNIVLYQAEWCHYCARVRSHLTDMLLDYKVVNVPVDHAERHIVKEVSGQTGIPTMVDGDVVIADDDDAIIDYVTKRYAPSSSRA